jgi:2-polyprenyl-3-methyl-5-hydroxy-6-metoxy-1,4-benzoquinol methylase
MATREARYDRAMDWYVGFVREWAADARPFPPTDVSGQRVLELGCGLGELSRHLAGRGASVTAVDLSTRMV